MPTESQSQQNRPAPAEAQSSARRWVVLVATLVAAAGVLGAVITLTTRPSDDDGGGGSSVSGGGFGYSDPELDRLARRVRVAEGRVQATQAQLDGLAKPSDSTRVAAQLAGLERRLRQIGGDLRDLQDAVLEDPAKAVQFTLLRRDLSSQTTQSRAQLASVRGDIDRQYDLMKWVIGTLFVGIAGMVLAVVVPALRRSAPSPPE